MIPAGSPAQKEVSKIDEVQQPEVPPQSSGGSSLLPKILAGVMAVYIAISGYFLYSMHSDLTALQQKQQAADNDLHSQIVAVRTDSKNSSAALAGQLGMTPKPSVMTLKK